MCVYVRACLLKSTTFITVNRRCLIKTVVATCCSLITEISSGQLKNYDMLSNGSASACLYERDLVI